MRPLAPYIIGALMVGVALSLFSFSSRFTKEEGEKKKIHRVVFHVTTPDTAAYRALMRQLNNVLDKWPDARIEVVAHNKGIQLLQKSKTNVSAELGALKKRGVNLYACEFTLQQQAISKEDIVPESGYVERGIIHIIERQEAGWAYIKAGF